MPALDHCRTRPTLWAPQTTTHAPDEYHGYAPANLPVRATRTFYGCALPESASASTTRLQLASLLVRVEPYYNSCAIMVWRRLPTLFPNIRLHMLPLPKEKLEQIRATGWTREVAFRTDPKTSKVCSMDFCKTAH